MKVLCHEGEAPQGWDARLESAAVEAGLCQSSLWARVLRKVDNAVPLFLEVAAGGRTRASLLLFHKVRWDRARGRRTKVGR